MRANSYFRNLLIRISLACVYAFVFFSFGIASSSVIGQEKKQETKKQAVVKKKAVTKAAPKKAVDAHDHAHDHAVEIEKGKGAKAQAAKGNADSKDGEFDPLKTKGAIDDVSKDLAKILRLKRKGARLFFDLPTSYADADAAFREIRKKSFGGGGGHGSGDFWTQYFTGQNMGGRIQKSEQNFGRNKPNPNAFVCEFIEITGRNRVMEIYGEKEDEFLIRICGGLDPYLLQIVQSKSGFVVQEANGLQSFAGRGDSFESFCKDHPDFVQTQFLPMLKKYGIATPATRFNSVTRDHVLDLLKPVEEQRISDFKNAFANLESQKFSERETAAKELNGKYKDWQDVIRNAIANESFSVEVRAKLQAMVQANSSESDRELVSLVTSADLKNDKEYLVWLLSQSKDDNEKTRIASQLSKVTKQDFGSDLAKWTAWISKSDSTGSTLVKLSELKGLATVSGYIPQMAEATSNLLSLTFSGDRLLLDREFWKDQFGGESIMTLVNRVQDQMEKSNLPKRWLSTGGNSSLATTRHEHVLFEHIQTAIPPQTEPNYYSYGNLSSYRRSQINRAIEQPHLYLKLDLQAMKKVDRSGRSSVAKTKPEFFSYSARERKSGHISLSLTEGNDQSLNILIADKKSNSMLQLVQDPLGKVICTVMSDGRKQSVSAKNAKLLYENHAAFLKEFAFPVMIRFGIQTDESFGGPHKISNAAKPTKKNRGR